jgi:pimeloyl-ACP methyl ester carboxylesterase
LKAGHAAGRVCARSAIKDDSVKVTSDRTLVYLTLVLFTLPVLAAEQSTAQAPEKTPMYVSPGQPPVECVARVNYDLYAQLAGYFVQDPTGKVCVPFTYRASFAPSGYHGDYFIAEFTDAKIKAKYAACREDRACTEKLAKIPPLNAVPEEFRVTGTVDPFGKIDPHGVVDLKQIRRPKYFGRAPYHEAIAEAEARTWTIEFHVPREAYERLHMKRTDPLALRGWYLQGTGVPDGKGAKTRALVILIAGRSVETTALEAPGELPYQYDKTKGSFVARTLPNASSEKWGVRVWRDYLYELNRAGFDVLTFDKRGHGISGGYEVVNTLEQGRDMWRALDALETGAGVRALSPSGELLEGAAVRGRFLAGMKAKQIPVIFGGSSQGSIATAWAMQQNFIEDCSYDLPEVRCSPAHHYNVKGALLLAPVEAGIAGRPAPVDGDAGVLDEARSRVEKNIVMLPSSEPVAHVDKWPAVFFAKGLWDFAESLEATFDTYRRATGLKELVVIRGPHAGMQFGGKNAEHVAARMVAFSKAAVLGLHEVPGAARFEDLRSLVATSPPYWEASSDPATF